MKFCVFLNSEAVPLYERVFLAWGALAILVRLQRQPPLTSTNSMAIAIRPLLPPRPDRR